MRLKTTHVCVTDFEATCWEDKRKEGDIRVNEIIEVGSAMISLKTMEVDSTFQIFINPAQSTKLSDFCTKLTSITQDQVDTAPLFPEALQCWKCWNIEATGGIGGVMFASWGLYDYKQLIKDCAFHCLEFPFRGDHLNVKEYVAGKMGWGKKGNGMGKAINRMGMKFEGTAHRGIDDAKMTAKVLLKAGIDWQGYGQGYRLTARDVFLGYPRGD